MSKSAQLNSRLSKLEGKGVDVEPFVITRTIVDPLHGVVGAYVDGKEIERRSDETEAEFRERIRR